jgi:hypothetical protein
MLTSNAAKCLILKLERVFFINSAEEPVIGVFREVDEIEKTLPAC